MVAFKGAISVNESSTIRQKTESHKEAYAVDAADAPPRRRSTTARIAATSIMCRCIIGSIAHGSPCLACFFNNGGGRRRWPEDNHSLSQNSLMQELDTVHNLSAVRIGISRQADNGRRDFQTPTPLFTASGPRRTSSSDRPICDPTFISKTLTFVYKIEVVHYQQLQTQTMMIRESNRNTTTHSQTSCQSVCDRDVNVHTPHQRTIVQSFALKYANRCPLSRLLAHACPPRSEGHDKAVEVPSSNMAWYGIAQGWVKS